MATVNGRRRAAARAAGAGTFPADRALRTLMRAYRSADRDLKSSLLACLVRPLGVLSLVAVAGGVFGVLLRRGGDGAVRVVIENVTRFSREHVAELASFAVQVDSQAMLDAAALIARSYR